MRFHRALIGSIAGFALVFASTTAAFAEPEPAEGDAEGVEWLLTSSDTLGTAIDRALETQTTEDVAAALAAFADRADDGKSVDMPGLSEASSEEVSDLTGSAAEALAAGDPLPDAVDSFPLDGSAAEAADGDEYEMTTTAARSRVNVRLVSTVDPDPDTDPEDYTDIDFDAQSASTGVIADGYAYRQTNWVSRGVTTGGGGFKTTDKIELRWVTNPGGASSRIDYTMKYFPDAGTLTNIRTLVRAYTEDTPIGQTGWKQQNKGSVSRTVDNSPSAKGKTIKHALELAAKSKSSGLTLSDQEWTETAKCESKTNRCKY